MDTLEFRGQYSNNLGFKKGYHEDEDFSVSPQSVAAVYSSSSPRRAERPTRESVLKRLSEALLRRSLTKIDLSQRGLISSDAKLVKMALLQNKNLTCLKLGYNRLADTGASIISTGIPSCTLQSLDLGFNDIGDAGCANVCNALSSSKCETLYLAGNLIGQDGAVSIATMLRKGSRLRKLYLTGNFLGPEGVAAIADAILASELDGKSCLEELYLGDVGMKSAGCQAVARLLRHTSKIRVLNLPNGEIHDEEACWLAASIKANERLPLESLQLSFNHISARGIEVLVGALAGCVGLRELHLDNNNLGDYGAQQLAGVLLPHSKIEVLKLGFNQISTIGLKILLKVVAVASIRNVCLSGNKVDTSAAKAVAYALAFSRTLESLSLVHCDIDHEGRRHISAGVVSNSSTVLRHLSGFGLGSVIVTLGLPGALGNWNNTQILTFVRLMWQQKHRFEEEKFADPLHCLPNAPQDATIVVDVAKRAYNALLATSPSGLPPTQEEPQGCPIVAAEGIIVEEHEQSSLCDYRRNSTPCGTSGNSMPARKVASFVASPEATSTPPDASRKKRVEDWFEVNCKKIRKLSDKPFDSVELWKLHQHFFTPIVKETGGESLAPSPSPSQCSVGEATSTASFPYARRATATAAASQANALGSLPLLKRKVSYHCLSEASLPSNDYPRNVALMLQENNPGLPNKKARRNRTRISFLPRTKAKLETYLESCHEKALVLMRQLYWVEQSLLQTHETTKHLSGSLAFDAEMIVVDLI